MKDRSIIAALVVIGAILGALREFLFVNLNYQIDHVSRETEFSYAHSRFQSWVDGWGLDSLVFSKWVLTILLAGVVLWMTLSVARILFKSMQYHKLIIGGYVLVGISALFLHLLSSAHPGFRLASVQLLHALQFPVIMVILILASSIVPRTTTEK